MLAYGGPLTGTAWGHLEAPLSRLLALLHPGAELTPCGGLLCVLDELSAPAAVSGHIVGCDDVVGTGRPTGYDLTACPRFTMNYSPGEGWRLELVQTTTPRPVVEPPWWAVRRCPVIIDRLELAGHVEPWQGVSFRRPGEGTYRYSAPRAAALAFQNWAGVSTLYRAEWVRLGEYMGEVVLLF